MRNALSYVPKAQQSMAAAALRQAFIQPDRASAAQALRHVADQLRGKCPKLGGFIDDSETDVLTHLDFPSQHRTRIHSTDDIDKRFFKSSAIFSWHGRPRGKEQRSRMQALPRRHHCRSSLVASVRRFVLAPCGRQCRIMCS
jgi:hypothetical protein